MYTFSGYCVHAWAVPWCVHGHWFTGDYVSCLSGFPTDTHTRTLACIDAYTSWERKINLSHTVLKFLCLWHFAFLPASDSDDARCVWLSVCVFEDCVCLRPPLTVALTRSVSPHTHTPTLIMAAECVPEGPDLKEMGDEDVWELINDNRHRISLGVKPCMLIPYLRQARVLTEMDEDEILSSLKLTNRSMRTSKTSSLFVSIILYCITFECSLYFFIFCWIIFHSIVFDSIGVNFFSLGFVYTFLWWSK